jgi:hypothetical protein
MAPDAAGIIPTEDLVWPLTRSGASSAVDRERVRAASDLLSAALGRPRCSRVREALGRPEASSPGS